MHPLSPSLAYALAWLAGWLAAYIDWCARLVGAVPFAQVGGTTALAVVACVLGAAAYALYRWRTT